MERGFLQISQIPFSMKFDKKIQGKNNIYLILQQSHYLVSYPLAGCEAFISLQRFACVLEGLQAEHILGALYKVIPVWKDIETFESVIYNNCTPVIKEHFLFTTLRRSDLKFLLSQPIDG